MILETTDRLGYGVPDGYNNPIGMQNHLLKLRYHKPYFTFLDF